MGAAIEWARLDGRSERAESDPRPEWMYRITDGAALRWFERWLVGHFLDGHQASADWGGSSDQHRLVCYLAKQTRVLSRDVLHEADIPGRQDDIGRVVHSAED